MKIQIVNEKDELIAVKERSEVDYSTDIYRVSALWITNSRGQALLAKRAATKDKDLSKWGPAVAGTIEEGETYDSNIYKEAEEEIGLTGMEFTKTRKLYTDHPRKEFTQWYAGTVDREIDDFTRQVEEVDELAWVDPSQIEQDLQSNPNKYIPGMPLVLSRLGLLSKENTTPPVQKPLLNTGAKPSIVIGTK
jgi:isopentenyl-diphosphate delta-isomerase